MCLYAPSKFFPTDIIKGGTGIRWIPLTTAIGIPVPRVSRADRATSVWEGHTHTHTLSYASSAQQERPRNMPTGLWPFRNSKLLSLNISRIF